MPPDVTSLQPDFAASAPDTVKTPVAVAPARRAGQHYPALDGLRGIAALVVVYQHAARGTLGLTAVLVFFALSGFLVGGVLMDDDAPGVIGRFYARRAARIWPLYFTVLTLVAISDVHYPGHPPRWPYWTFTFPLVNNPNCARWALAPMWSLSNEEHFYLLLPLLVASVPRRWLGLALVALAAVSVSIRAAEVLYPSLPRVSNIWTPAILDMIAYGAFSAWVWRYRPAWSAYAGGVACFAFGAAFGAYGRPTAYFEPSFFSSLFTWPAPCIGTAALVLCLVSGRAPRLSAVLGWRPLAFLGEVSYGVYLIHGLMVDLFLERTNLDRGPMLFLVVTAMTVSIALLSRRYFEDPIIAAVKRWTAPRQPEPVLATA
jgi:peptidoglycan/LPS O-acetylase OafA/YrhL